MKARRIRLNPDLGPPRERDHAPYVFAPTDPPLRVLAVVPGAGEGVSFVFARRQMATVRDLGVDVQYFWLVERTSPLRVARELFRLRKVVEEMKPDIVHAHYGTVTAMVSMLASRRPLVITFRGTDLNGTDVISRLRSTMGVLMSQVAALSATEIVCVSDQLRQVLWRRRGNVEVIPSGVDASVFRPIPIAAARRTLGWATDHRVVLFNASRKSKAKRLDLAQSAVVEAKKLISWCRMEILDGHVDPSRIATLMNAADCLLMTSDLEGSPNVIKEALACNLPIVSVDVGDVRERVAGVRPGRVVERDPHLLGVAIAEILANPMRSNGREVITEITATRVAERLVDVYRRALGRL